MVFLHLYTTIYFLLLIREPHIYMAHIAMVHYKLFSRSTLECLLSCNIQAKMRSIFRMQLLKLLFDFFWTSSRLIEANRSICYLIILPIRYWSGCGCVPFVLKRQVRIKHRLCRWYIIYCLYPFLLQMNMQNMYRNDARVTLTRALQRVQR